MLHKYIYYSFVSKQPGKMNTLNDLYIAIKPMTFLLTVVTRVHTKYDTILNGRSFIISNQLTNNKFCESEISLCGDCSNLSDLDDAIDKYRFSVCCFRKKSFKQKTVIILSQMPYLMLWFPFSRTPTCISRIRSIL